MALASDVSNIKTASTTTVVSGSGLLRRIVVNGGGDGTATVYDNTEGSGDTIATITSAASDQPFAIEYDAIFLTGLTIVTSAAMDLTVIALPFPRTA